MINIRKRQRFIGCRGNFIFSVIKLFSIQLFKQGIRLFSVERLELVLGDETTLSEQCSINILHIIIERADKLETETVTEQSVSLVKQEGNRSRRTV